ncbi:hypothetical protein Z517_08391 [Fonsecaea pedrosoi CBS 271.37]|uniref:Zn(2)-C6 fungal-type domain-containing protein n=1 Tax=Fonsecaea pedrosoi CBS 271.37 TaxID=1442368 RepID=A0A0D2GCW3_9EURO|nr:uncharacterized protein Z517_08391 [Fonsecaea pedrosoi CBS 271.37]KIW78553.1 hypothetical protein Z517_08391 [Fonsecaea pedrosoi CBS 271.37]
MATEFPTEDAQRVENGDTQGSATTSEGNRPRKKGRACIPCHERKLKCNASGLGSPCTRCITSGRADICIPFPERPRWYDQALPADLYISDLTREKTSVKRRKTANASYTSVPDILGETQLPGSDHMGTSLVEINPLLDDPRNISNLDDNPPANEHNSGTKASDGELSARTSTCWLVSPLGSKATDHETVAKGTDESCVAVEEEDAHLQMYLEMSKWPFDGASPTKLSHPESGREVIELLEGEDSIAILGEALGRKQRGRLVRIVLKDPHRPGDPSRSHPQMDAVDYEYLQRKGAFRMPPREARDKMIRLYFERVYPYTPVLDREEFIQEYRADQCSPFVLSAMLANVVPYMSLELLLEAGFSDRLAAQKSFYSKAQLLYDFCAERRPLRLLQGSLILSSLSPSFSPDRDFRYWLTNSVRLAIQMGFHREHVFKNLGPGTAKLFRRIWWALYNRDVLLNVSGHYTVRRIRDCDFDTKSLTEDDWEPPTAEPRDDLIPPIPRIQKLYFLEACKLSIICGQFIQTFRTAGVTPSEEDCLRVGNALTSWRCALPVEFHLQGVGQWTAQNIWILLIIALSYRLECILCRALRQRYQSFNDHEKAQEAAQKQENALFEVDTVIERVLQNGIAHLFPLSLTTCVSAVLALHIESALQPNISPGQKFVTRARIHTGLTYMRETCEYWGALKWTLRMLEVIVEQTGLSATPTAKPVADADGSNTTDPPRSPQFPISFSEVDDTLNLGVDDLWGPLMRRDDDWVQDFLGSNLLRPDTDFDL